MEGLSIIGRGGAIWIAITLALTDLVIKPLVSLARIYVGVHYPLDVLGGAVLGLACAWLADRVMALRAESTSA
jgi:hypothetical protein